MINFEKFTLSNGLRIIVHKDTSTPLVALNILYDVGARDEDPEKTGFAHLFEHLMFGGSVNIPKYDEPLEKVGGENNAFTSNDVTNYYLTVPRQNLETGFWLESDRMYQLAFSEKSLEVQRNVVSEEFRQTHLNQPYGDVWLLLRPEVFKVHPYQWPTIGKEISHITNATMEDVRSFYNKFYNPNNAVMVVSGNVTAEEVNKLAGRWFAPIENTGKNVRTLPAEPEQQEERRMEVERNVPSDAIYKVWHMCGRMDAEYHTTDLISDVLGNGNSSRFYQKLVKEEKLFSELDAYIMGSFDKGMFVVSGKPAAGIGLDKAEAAINREISALTNQAPAESELQKVKNSKVVNFYRHMATIDGKANLIGQYEIFFDSYKELFQAPNEYKKVTVDDIKRVAKTYFKKSNRTIGILKAMDSEEKEKES